MQVWQVRIPVMAAVLAALLTVAACGEGETRDNVDVSFSGPGATATVSSFKPISSATPAPSATPGSASSGGAAGSGRPLTITARDNLFDPKELTAEKGTAYTLTLTNRGSALHNWHLIGTAGEPKTDLINGGATARVTFTLADAGSFTYRCDVHPGEMEGKITVR